MFDVTGPDFMVALLEDAAYDEVERFVRGLDSETEPETVLATVLFTDIVGSTARRSRARGPRLGGARVQDTTPGPAALDAFARLRDRHGRATGSSPASTDRPGDPLRRVRSCESRRARSGVEVRAGLHTGECELVDGKIGGLAVSHRRARRASRAGPGELLVSQTVKDLVAGSASGSTTAGSTS